MDGELTGDAKAALERHIDTCQDCLRRLGVERQFKQWLHDTCTGERAPEDLRESIRRAIAT